jgi:hypothetical protein
MRAKTNITQAIMTVHKALDYLSHDESIRRLEALVQEIHSQQMMEIRKCIELFNSSHGS